MYPLLSQAQSSFHIGNLTESHDLCLRILVEAPENAEAMELLGLIERQLGNFVASQTWLERAIAVDPANVRALFNYGFFLSQDKRHDEALTIFLRVAELAPALPEVHFNMGNVLQVQGKGQESIQHYQRAVALRPDYHDAWYNLGMAHKNIEQYAEAVESFKQVLRVLPAHADALFNLGLVQHSMNLLPEAIATYERFLELYPDSPTVAHNLGGALRNSNRPSEAIQWLTYADAMRPGDPNILNNLGSALKDCGRMDEAVEAFQKALQLNPNHSDTLSNLANILLEKEQFSEAADDYKRAIAVNPAFHEAWYNLGNCHTNQNQPDEAIAHYRRAITIKPDLVEAHWNLSHALLLTGQYKEGFAEYRWRWQRKSAAKVNIPTPQWNGEPLPGGTLLVHTEQGMGDSIQFIRYLALAASRVGRIILCCEPSLVSLFQTAPGVAAIVEKKAITNLASMAHRQIPLLDLPAIFTNSEASIPKDIPYLFAEKRQVAESASIFSPYAGQLKVGLVWQGNPDHKNDHNRSIAPERLMPLLSLPKVAYFSLQKRISPPADIPLVDLSEHLNTFADTAAMLEHLDLVISVDTSVAHLAGALGRPVWTLLPFVPDWRWGLEREDSPWYPTMRLFRQKERRNWDEVIQRIIAEIKLINRRES